MTSNGSGYFSLTGTGNRVLIFGSALIMTVVLVWNFFFGPSTISPDVIEAYERLSVPGLTAAVVGGVGWLIFAVAIAFFGVLFLNLLARSSVAAGIVTTARVILVSATLGIVGVTSVVPHALMSTAVGHVVNLDEIVYRDPVTFVVYVGGALVLTTTVVAGLIWAVTYRVKGERTV